MSLGDILRQKYDESIKSKNQNNNKGREYPVSGTMSFQGENIGGYDVQKTDNLPPIISATDKPEIRKYRSELLDTNFHWDCNLKILTFDDGVIYLESEINNLYEMKPSHENMKTIHLMKQIFKPIILTDDNDRITTIPDEKIKSPLFKHFKGLNVI